MTRRPGQPQDRAEALRQTETGIEPQPALHVGGERAARLVALCDYCASARRIADESGEKLLAYLLAMAIQEAQTALRRLGASTSG